MCTKKDNINSFIEKAIKVHGNKYDYSQANYINSSTKLKIICPEHGIFEQRAGQHIYGYGCKGCGSEKAASLKRKLLDDFINKAKEVHNNKYTYGSIVKYTNNTTKVCITCPIHGNFWQEPKSHLNGCGCSECRAINMHICSSDNIEVFIEKAVDIHGNTYDYSNAIYINNKTKIEIICKEHQSFWQKPNAHLRGNGCPICNKSPTFWSKSKFVDYYKNQDVILYIVRLQNENEDFIKVGFTGMSVKERMWKIPYNHKIIHTIVSDASTVWDYEKQFHRLLHCFKYRPKISFGGESECFTLEAVQTLALTKGIDVSKD